MRADPVPVDELSPELQGVLARPPHWVVRRGGLLFTTLVLILLVASAFVRVGSRSLLGLLWDRWHATPALTKSSR